MGGSPAAAPTPEPERIRPPYLRPVGPAPQQRLFEADQDRSDRSRSRDRRSIPRPVPIPSSSPGQAQLARWIERYAVRLTPKGDLPHLVHYRGADRPAFHGGRAFVLRFGAALIVRAIRDLTYWTPTTTHDFGDYNQCRAGACACPSSWARAWKDEIVSPARRLYAYVDQLDGLSRNQLEDRRP